MKAIGRFQNYSGGYQKYTYSFRVFFEFNLVLKVLLIHTYFELFTFVSEFKGS